MELSLAQIDQIREQGLRPQVVGCFVNQGKILFVYKENFNLWQLPQGGIDNKETLEQALWREMKEELGEKFVGAAEQEIEILGTGQLPFPKKLHGSRDLQTDDGKPVQMTGKKYIFLAIKAGIQELDLSESEFDNYRFVDYAQGMELAETIYQSGKKRITTKVLELLKKAGLV